MPILLCNNCLEEAGLEPNEAGTEGTCDRCLEEFEILDEEE